MQWKCLCKSTSLEFTEFVRFRRFWRKSERGGKGAFTVVFYGLRIFGCKTAQFCVTPRKAVGKGKLCENLNWATFTSATLRSATAQAQSKAALLDSIAIRRLTREVTRWEPLDFGKCSFDA